MRRKEQSSTLALAIIMAFVLGVFWAGPVGAEKENPCAALKRVAERLGCPGAPVEKTGQIECYDTYGVLINCAETGQDGDLQKGVAWPDPRFTDNGDETVTDNLTGLMWAEDASAPDRMHWGDALIYCNELELGGYDDWRLPNVKELQSLIHYGVYNPALPNTNGTGKWLEGDPFTGVESSNYWSSTTYAGYPYNPGIKWFVYLYYGTVHFDIKYYHYYVWPVRGGE